VHKFFESHHFALGILPIPGASLLCSSACSAQGARRARPARVLAGALHSLQRLAATCDLVVVTSRQHCIRQPTLEWIERHFPGVFAEVHFGNHWALEGQSKAKSEICRRAYSAPAKHAARLASAAHPHAAARRDIGASVLIDDNPRYAVECAEAGMEVLLYDWQLCYPWSKTADG